MLLQTSMKVMPLSMLGTVMVVEHAVSVARVAAVMRVVEAAAGVGGRGEGGTAKRRRGGVL